MPPHPLFAVPQLLAVGGSFLFVSDYPRQRFAELFKRFTLVGKILDRLKYCLGGSHFVLLLLLKMVTSPNIPQKSSLVMVLSIKKRRFLSIFRLKTAVLVTLNQPKSNLLYFKLSYCLRHIQFPQEYIAKFWKVRLQRQPTS